MNKSILSLLLAGTAVCLTAADKHPWASFKPGSYAKYKTTSAVAGNKTVTEMTYTLVSLDANNAVVETETKVMGQVTKNKVNMPLKAAANTDAKGKAPVMTNETVTAAGKSIACKCFDATSNTNGMAATTHACSSESVPGGMVKSVTKTSGAMKMETTMELVDFVAK